MEPVKSVIFPIDIGQGRNDSFIKIKATCGSQALYQFVPKKCILEIVAAVAEYKLIVLGNRFCAVCSEGTENIGSKGALTCFVFFSGKQL